MGREVKRVALNFDWPVNKVWEGYKNPHYKDQFPCHNCEGSGYAEEAHKFHEQWYGYVEFDPVKYGSKLITKDNPALRKWVERQVDRSIEEEKREDRKGRNYYTEDGYFSKEEAIEREILRLLGMYNSQWVHHLIKEDIDALIEKDRLWDFTRVPLEPLENYIRTRAYYLWIEAGKPVSDGVEFWEKAAEEHEGHWLPFSNGYVPTPEEVTNWAMVGFGHDSSNSFYCIKARCKRENVEVFCEVCNGNGRLWYPEESEKLADEWKSTEPPVGEGYQIWETVSEGSPISPVFSDPKILAEFMANSPPWGGAQAITAEKWLEWIVGPGWAPSGMITNGVYQDGVNAVLCMEN